MEYHGKLYGKIGSRWFDTGVTSKDYDALTTQHAKMVEMLEDILSGMKGENFEVSEHQIESLLSSIKKGGSDE